MISTKENIRKVLIKTGRRLVKEKGAEYLTARKLSDASGYSIGTIYNQYGTMDGFIMEQNRLTMNELLSYMRGIFAEDDAYLMLNRYLDTFVSFVLANKNLWFLLYNFHLNATYQALPKDYLRKLIEVTTIWKPYFDKVYPNLLPKERKLALHVLWLALFSVSSFLTTNALDSFSKINRKNLCKLLLNTYLAGLTVLDEAR
ncbi:MAG: TetR/AcrR family transcriptional regulator [Alphaproteobacteria bacterium]|nr:TetR/AcrR family transcriptional regulator [Alphaproteobacteria bacterium]